MNRNDTFPEIKIGKNLSDVFLTYPELKAWSTVAMPLKAGSASFHSGHLIHVRKVSTRFDISWRDSLEYLCWL
jgi:hypothetical protein